MSEQTAKAEPEKIFNKDMSSSYDERNKRLAKISDCLHFLSGLALTDLPANARILCVGVGTGADILALSEAHPGWRFVGVDPSDAMLDVCREKVVARGMAERCSLIHGYVTDVAEREFDAVVSFFVGHFIPEGQRPDFYAAIIERLKPGGRFITAEISYDLSEETAPAIIANWGEVQRQMGATPENLARLPTLMRENLAVLSHEATESLLNRAGFPMPVKFFQAFMIAGWHAQKPG